MKDISNSGYFNSPLRYDIVDCFVDEVIKLETKMAFHYKKTKKDIFMAEKIEENFENNSICRFFE